MSFPFCSTFLISTGKIVRIVGVTLPKTLINIISLCIFYLVSMHLFIRFEPRSSISPVPYFLMLLHRIDDCI
jgi:hypothetical protein